jgi:uncharacterized membrane protein
MSRLLVIGAVAWLLLLGSATWARVGHQRAPEWTQIVYAAAGLVCHQRPDRSFRTAGAQWPVCGRCSGLYLAAPIGALVALWGRRRAFHVPGSEVRGSGVLDSGTSTPEPGNSEPRNRKRRLGVLLLAAVPTVITLAIEWLHLAPASNLLRAAAALPLGGTIAWMLVRVTQQEHHMWKV